MPGQVVSVSIILTQGSLQAFGIREHNWDIFICGGLVGEEKGLVLEMQSQCREQKNKVSVDTKRVIQALEQAELAGILHSSLVLPQSLEVLGITG